MTLPSIVPPPETVPASYPNAGLLTAIADKANADNATMELKRFLNESSLGLARRLFKLVSDKPPVMKSQEFLYNFPRN
jgi:hypothetical protein